MARYRKTNSGKPLPYALNVPITVEQAPIFPPDIDIFSITADAEISAAAKEYEGQIREKYTVAAIEKMEKLFEHYGIDPALPNGWRDMAIAIALDIIPGFALQLGTSEGAPVKIDAVFELKLLVAVYEETKCRKDTSSPKNISAICRWLKKQEPWKSMNITPKRLQNIHSDARGNPLFAAYLKVAENPRLSNFKDDFIEMLYQATKSSR